MHTQLTCIYLTVWGHFFRLLGLTCIHTLSFLLKLCLNSGPLTVIKPGRQALLDERILLPRRMEKHEA